MHLLKKIFILVVLSFLFFSCKDDSSEKIIEEPPVVEDNVLAFPGADGAGQYATGGRGGVVYYVTSLDDDILKMGTLRYALNQTGARIIVFSVSGTIQLVDRLRINKGNVTIAGQTAPGKGITLSDNNVYITASNVIVRFLRFRMGDVTVVTDDAFGAQGGTNVLIDHCSLSWCTDECGSFYDNTDFTLQWCILSESLRISVHDKGTHGYGGIWGGKNASFHHNLLASHDSRNPRFCGSRFSNQASLEKVDFRNNVIYNWQGNSGYGGEGGVYNMINNYYKPGPATLTRSANIQYRIFQPNADVGDYAQASGVWGKFYVSGNYMSGYPAVTADNWNGGIQPNPGTYPLSSLKLDTEIPFSYLNTQTAENAYTSVLAYAGASLLRDTIDARIINEVTNGTYTFEGSEGSTNGLIDSQADVGGWPEVRSVIQQQRDMSWDTDFDGMPNDWEDTNGLNKTNAADRNYKTLDPNGKLTNIEVYLNSLVNHLYPD